MHLIIRWKRTAWPQELATHLCPGHCCIFYALNVRRTHDVLCPAKRKSLLFSTHLAQMSTRTLNNCAEANEKIICTQLSAFGEENGRNYVRWVQINMHILRDIRCRPLEWPEIHWSNNCCNKIWILEKD